MIRKTLLGFAAVAALGAAALAPTSASAWGFHHHGWGHGFGWGYYGPGYVKYRYTYPGYVNGFPPPAFLYYGYPQSGSGSNPGLMP